MYLFVSCIQTRCLYDYWCN